MSPAWRNTEILEARAVGGDHEVGVKKGADHDGKVMIGAKVKASAAKSEGVRGET